MGLDMYLQKSVYVWSHKDEHEALRKAIKETIDADAFEDTGVELKYTIHYWRKANQIHKWFVDHVQRGEDDCGDYLVECEQIVELRDACRLALENTSEDILPPQAGFFFGDTDKDEYYWSEIEETLSSLEEIMSKEDWKQHDYYYSSSW